MGAGQSKEVKQSAGVVALTSQNQKFIEMLEMLLRQLVHSTNPINFEKALSATQSGTCGGMLVLLQPMIDREFHKFLIQNPESRESVLTIFKGYGDKADEIDKLMESGLSRTICREITKFFLRFILTIVALVLSVRTNRATLGLLGTLGSTLNLTEAPRDTKGEGYSEIFYGEGITRGVTPVKQLKPGNDPENERKLSEYVRKLFQNNTKDSSNKKLIEAKTDRYYRITYNGKKFIFDISRLFFYELFTDKEPRRVGLIELSGSNRDAPGTVEPPAEIWLGKGETSGDYRPPEIKLEGTFQQKPQQSQQPQQRPQQSQQRPQQFQQRPQQFQQRPGSQQKSRKSRNFAFGKRTRKNKMFRHVGGDNTNKKDDHDKKDHDSSKLTYYVFTRGAEGCQNTSTIRKTCPYFSTNVIHDVNNIGYEALTKFISAIAEQYESKFINPSSEFRRKIDSGEKWKFTTKYFEGFADTSLSTKGLTITEPSTYDSINKLLSDSVTMTKIVEGTSPAFYRAYLIASGLTSFNEKTQLQTYFCNDKWARKSLSEIPAYSILKNLYYDKIEAIAEMNPETKEEMDNFLERMKDTGSIGMKSGTISDPFSNYLFSKVESKKCTDSKALVLIDNEDRIEETKIVYNQIAAELISHISGIEKILNEMIDLPLFMSADSRLKIKSVFFTDKEGASKALEKIIKKARVLLADHYVKIETLYVEGVKAIDPEAKFAVASVETTQYM